MLGLIVLMSLFCFGYALPVPWSIAIVTAISMLDEVATTLLELRMGGRRLIVRGWLVGGMVGSAIVLLVIFFNQPFAFPHDNPFLVLTFILPKMAVAVFRPQFRAWLAARLGLPSNHD